MGTFQYVHRPPGDKTILYHRPSGDKTILYIYIIFTSKHKPFVLGVIYTTDIGNPGIDTPIFYPDALEADVWEYAIMKCILFSLINEWVRINLLHSTKAYCGRGFILYTLQGFIVIQKNKILERSSFFRINPFK